MKRRPWTTPRTLRPRERDVLILMANGYTLQEAAWVMGLALKTVRTYLARSLVALHAANQAQAVANALRCGEILPDTIDIPPRKQKEREWCERPRGVTGRFQSKAGVLP